MFIRLLPFFRYSRSNRILRFAMFIGNLTLYDDVAPGCDAGPVTEAAGGSFGPSTVGVAAGVPTLFLVVSLIAHVVRLSDSVRRLIDSFNQFIDRIRAFFNSRSSEPEGAASASCDVPTVSAQDVPMRNLSDSQRAALTSAPSGTTWM